MTYAKIVLIFIVMLTAGLCIKVTSSWRKMNMDYQVRIAFTTSGISQKPLDPAKIDSFYQSVILENLYSRLIEYDDDGNFQSGIATKFYWKEDLLVFEFGEKAKTKSGHYISATDAAISIRRVLKLDSSTHTNLQYFICKIETENDVFSDCESIFVKDGRLYLKIVDERYRSFVVSTLAAGDFAIIPEMAINKQTLMIDDYSNTSGPYYVDSMSEKWRLVKNEEHYNNSAHSPREVVLVSPDHSSAADLFIKNQVDIVPTAHNISKEHFLEISKKVPDLKVFKTLPIKLFFLRFSLAAIRKTTTSQRFYIASRFKNIMDASYPLPIFSEETREFFLGNSFGKLSSSRLQAIGNLYSEIRPQDFRQKISFYLYARLKNVLSVFGSIKELELVETEHFPFDQKLEDRLDLSLVTTDTGYEEDLSLIRYNFNQGTFGYSNSEAQQWLKHFLDTGDRNLRGLQIEDLHFQSLKDGIIFPLYKAPYVVLTRNGYDAKLAQISASTRFWKIKKHAELF